MLWIPVTLLATLAQTGRNAAQAGMTRQIGTAGATQVRFLFGLPFASETVSHIQITVFGGLIMFFLIVEPHGLARLWQNAKEKLRLWPFPH